ncbi:unnamed protein product [Adineta steineri]|uniref:G-protein coupled receptors family 1 profile domain-containing protein n=1 Tax=Adineta steineri TaxID=433720 RepID=A0A814TSW3_9BILA|nr:unnamed protein product [Adineta steineri]CAF1379496.1 unnamed protein product [Adineta steineri]
MNIPSWYILLDIISMVCVIAAFILATIFLFIIVREKTCHTVPMMLIANSCLAELIFASNLTGMAAFALGNDIKQSLDQDSLCIFRGYMTCVAYNLQNYSYLLQAMHRYVAVFYPTRLYYQSVRFQIAMIFLTWIFGIICPIPIVLTGQIKYDVDNQICAMPLGFSFVLILFVFYAYLIPIGGIVFIYLKLLRYVKEIHKRVIPVNTLARAQRELKMVQRVVILVSILVALGIPYIVFLVMSFFTSAPEYYSRIAYTFADISVMSVMIALFQFTDPIKTYIMRTINRRPNTVFAIPT